ncbi:hypothetical protein TNIN_475221, partial [Trichonephila inaurata madagascariensis]
RRGASSRGPVRSRGELFKRPSPYNQSRHYRQESKYQCGQQPEQDPRKGRSSRHSQAQSQRSRQYSRQQDRLETNRSPASRMTASLEVLIGDVKDRRKH